MELDTYARFLLALVFVLALIGGLTWAARRFGLGGKLIPNKGGTPRLKIVEVVPLDARRKLVLLRRDGVEHLVLLGSGSDLLVETDIRNEGAMEEPSETSPAPAPQDLTPAPEPVP